MDPAIIVSLLAFGLSALSVYLGEGRAKRDEARADEKRADDERRWQEEAAREHRKMREERKRFVATLDTEREKLRAESERWRDERRATKAAEVAGELAVAAQRFLIALDSIADASAGDVQIPAIRLGGEDMRDNHELRREMTRSAFDSRWRDAAPTFDAFIHAWNAAAVYLGDDVNNLCDTLWRYRAEVRANQSTWLATMGMPGADPAHFRRGVGPDVHQRVASLRETALRTLRPLAQLAPAAHATAAEPSIAVPPTRIDETVGRSQKRLAQDAGAHDSDDAAGDDVSAAKQREHG